jgi:hypothetical protein
MRTDKFYNKDLTELIYWEKLLKHSLHKNITKGQVDSPADLIIIRAHNKLSIEIKKHKQRLNSNSA